MSTNNKWRLIGVLSGIGIAVLLYLKRNNNHYNLDLVKPLKTIKINKQIKSNKIYSKLDALKNIYYIVRHGESEANVLNIVSCDPNDAIHKHGLTKKGEEQALAAGRALSSLIANNPHVRIISSDFKRTVETAQAIQSILRVRDIEFVASLRERNFGEFHGKKGSDSYPRVWFYDERSIFHTMYHSESIHDVFTRTTTLIEELERKYQNNVIILVSHGDICGLMRAAFRGIDPRGHRLLPNVANCEIIPLEKRLHQQHAEL